MSHFLIAMLMAMIACVLIYLTSKQQNWLSQRLTSPVILWIAVLLLIVSLALLMVYMQAVAAVFLFLAWSMLLLLLLPYIGVVTNFRKH